MAKKRTTRQFLESVATYDQDLDHKDKCGICHHKKCMAKAAKTILASGNVRGGIARWDKEAKRLWQRSKYYKLWQAEKAAGRDPHKAFKKKGWEP